MHDGDLYNALTERALAAVIDVLERSPELAARLRAVLHEGRIGEPAGSIEYMSVREYALHRRISERALRDRIKEMTVGAHYERDGRRVVIRVREADDWYAQRSKQRTEGRAIEQIVLDEVTRRRARIALARSKER